MTFEIKQKKRFLEDYVSQTPLALAFERGQECYLYPTEKFHPNVMDFGCGDGIFSSILLDHQIDFGIDLNFRELQSARKLSVYKNLINASGYSLPIKNESINTLISNSVMEHIPNINSALRELNRVLSIDGKFYVTVPSEQFDQASIFNRFLRSLGFEGLANKFRVQYNKFWKHYHYYSASEWRKLFQEAGFSVSESFSYESKKMASINDALVICSVLSFFIKKITNRFVLFPDLRRKFFSPFIYKLENKMSTFKRQKHGVLLFFILDKG